MIKLGENNELYSDYIVIDDRRSVPAEVRELYGNDLTDPRTGFTVLAIRLSALSTLFSQTPHAESTD